MSASSSFSDESEFFDASDIAELPPHPAPSSRERSKSGSKKNVPAPSSKAEPPAQPKPAARPTLVVPSLVLPAHGAQPERRGTAHSDGSPSPSLTPRARLRATEGPSARRPSREPQRRGTGHGHSGSDKTPREDNTSFATDISIDDLASIAAAHGDDDVYLTDLTTGETFSIDQLRKKDGEEGGEQGLYAKGKLFVVGTAVGARDDSDREPGKGKSIKSLLQQVDSSVSTQKANLLKRIDSLTKGDEEGAARSPSPAPPTSPLANGLRKDEKQPSFFRKFGKDSKKERDGSPAAAGPSPKLRVNILNSIPPRNPPPRIARKHKQKRKTLGALRLLEEISAHKGAVWALKFSHDCRYLASGGHDMVLRIWKVRDSLRDLRLLEPAPACTFVGHQGDILDIAWSRAQFILTSSMDKTVRLWHITREDCLYVFNHEDFVTSVAFHPTNDRLFLSGCLDKKLRLWSIPDKAVVEWKDVGGFVTAATFTPNGRTAIAATYDGKCTFYEGETLRWITQVNADPKAKGSSGKKITGLEILPGGGKLLITSNDSRLRLYHLSDYSLVCTYKGLTNNSYQIRASFSDDGKFIISGSEDHAAYLWDTEPQQNTWAPYINPLRTSRQDRSDMYESFETQAEGSTLAAVFVPKSVYASQIEGCDDANLDRLIVTADTFGTIKVWFARPDAGTTTTAP